MKKETKNQFSAVFFGLMISAIIFCVCNIIALFFEDPKAIYWMGGSLCGIAFMATFIIYMEKKTNVANKFFQAKELLFNHVGFTPDWVEYAIDDMTEMYWRINTERNIVCYSKSLKADVHGDDYYEDAIYTQRFYKQWVYRGEEVTMIFCNPGVDGIQWFRVFDNKKEVKI